ncbi:MAG: hypothetical protein QM602_08225 [Microbacterium sp.]
MMAENTRSDDDVTHLWLVNNDLPEDVAEEFNQWYSDVHIPQLLQIPGFVSGRRFALSPVQNGSKEPELRRYLSVFELAGDPQAVFDALRAAVTAGRVDPAPFPGSVSTTANFVPIGPKLTS